MKHSNIVNKTPMPYRLDQGIAHRAAIGLIALATDQTIEQEWRQLLNIEGVAFFANRIFNSAAITLENLKMMEADLAESAALILPDVSLDVIAYACTSASMLIGEEVVARHICQGRGTDVKCTTPITAAKAAFQELGVGNIALLTPYIEEINRQLRSHLETAGIKVPVMGSFNNGNDNEVMRISLDSIRDAALELGGEPSVDGVFISCTSLRGAALIEILEAQLNKPVTTSCHALAWHALRLAGCTEPVPGQGRLFRI